MPSFFTLALPPAGSNAGCARTADDAELGMADKAFGLKEPLKNRLSALAALSRTPRCMKSNAWRWAKSEVELFLVAADGGSVMRLEAIKAS